MDALTPRAEAEIDLEDLETAAAFLGAAGLFDPKNRATCEAFARSLMSAVDAGNRIVIVGRGAKRMPPADRWRISLDETPQPWRSEAARALAAIIGRGRVHLDRIDYLL